MKPFNLEEALRGEKVVLRNGSQAYVLAKKPDDAINQWALIGCLCGHGQTLTWGLNGKEKPFEERENPFDILGMYQPKRETVTVTLTLPCPLKEWQPDCWFIDLNITGLTPEPSNKLKKTAITNKISYGNCFASKEDAQAWIDAMKNNRA